MKETSLAVTTQSMSSLQIAEVTGKRHANIMRDISNLLEQGVNELNFELVEYTDKKGEARPCYQLTKKGCLILASGYNAVLREKIIDRWEELESGKAEPMVKTQVQAPAQITMSDRLAWVKEVKQLLNLNDTSTLGLLQKIGEPLGLPLPERKLYDPFICSLTPHGVLIHAKWGAEAEDATIKRYEQLRDAIIGKGGVI